MTLDISKTISQYIENQFPAIYREEGEALVEFLVAYYEYLEESGYTLSREMFELKDIDTTYDEFVNFFRKKYLEDFPFVTATDNRFLVKNIIDYYRAKGSEQSLKLLMKLVFNDEVEVYYPRIDILRPSDSRWVVPRYIELTFSTRTKSFVGKTVYGNVSGATGFAESIVTKRIDGKLIDLLFISNITGEFSVNEYISDDTSVVNAPRMIGSLTAISDVESSSSGYAVGDKLDIISSNGKNAVARITRVLTAADRVNISLLDGGFGYTLDNDTKIYVSKDVLYCDNSSLGFKDFELVSQQLEEVDKPIATVNVGDAVVGFNSANTQIATGSIVTVNANTVVVEISSGTLKPRFTLNLETDNEYVVGDILEIEKNYDLDLENITGAFDVGEDIIQSVLVGGVNTDIAVGEVSSFVASPLSVSVIEGFGTFKVGLVITGKTSGATATITAVDLQSSSEKLVVLDIPSSNTITTELFSELLLEDNILEVATPLTVVDIETKRIKDTTSNIYNTALAATISGNYYEVNASQQSINSFVDKSAMGFVIGQTGEVVAISGNRNSFIFVVDATNTISSFDTLLTKTLTRIGTGSGAGFEVMDIEDTEVVNLGSELIGSKNIVEIKFLDVGLGGANTAAGTIEMDSGIGRIGSIDVISGGTGYTSNSTVTFSGGGLSGSEPLFPAEASVTANSGVIISVDISYPGEGYFEVPVVTISDGVDANLDIIMDYGFGFAALPYSNLQTVINDALSSKSMTIGVISEIGNITRGSGYDTNPFFKAFNPFIADYNRYDAFITYSNPVGGTYAFNEIVTASNGAKGRIRDITSDVLLVRKLSFADRFAVGTTIVGSVSSANSAILGITYENGNIMGNNARFRTFVNLASGIVAEVEVISSGIGYIQNERISLTDQTSGDEAATGTSIVQKQGKSTGFWETTTSHLNEKFLQDNFFYQEFSYQVLASLSFNRYEGIVRDILHVAGMELFGDVYINTKVATNISGLASVSLGTSVFTTVEMIGDENIVGVTYDSINIDATQSGVGYVDQVIVLSGGTGYSNTSIVTFTGGNTDPMIFVSAEATVSVDGSGSIINIVITEPGEGYYEAPTITIDEGSGANVEVEMIFGYGFPKLPYSSGNTLISEAVSEGEFVFENEVVLF